MLKDLIEMTVKSLRNLLILGLVVILAADFKALLSSQVVEIEHLRVLSKGI